MPLKKLRNILKRRKSYGAKRYSWRPRRYGEGKGPDKSLVLIASFLLIIFVLAYSNSRRGSYLEVLKSDKASLQAQLDSCNANVASSQSELDSCQSDLETKTNELAMSEDCLGDLEECEEELEWYKDYVKWECD